MRSCVAISPLLLIRILRPILRGYRLQKHLTDCALYEIVDRALSPYLAPLTWRHVIGLMPLPPIDDPNILTHPRFKRIDGTVGTR
jgi:hypothetical protein